ncbi:MAG: hypothetical protein ACTHK7_22645 [Aureliella sp.]
MNSAAGPKAFTQTWLQSLTLVARNPVAQGIKPLLDTINDLCQPSAQADRPAAARRLWDFGAAEGLQNVLTILPVQQPNWLFDRDSSFTFKRTGRDEIADFETWSKCLGIEPNEVPLVAEVTSRDWLNLVRQEAVRLQKAMSAAAISPGLNLSLPCTAAWDLKGWSIRFDQADWVVIRYDEPFTVERPSMEELDEPLMWAVATAHDALVPKTLPKLELEAKEQPWMSCVKRLEPLHTRVLVKEARQYSPWFRRVWACVWTVIYREQNVLGGRADIDVVRQELAECVGLAPRLTIWMFAFAKLVCECQLGRGLGISGDYAV